MSNTELQSCPFCGGEGVLYSVNLPMEADCDDIYVKCLDCDAVGPSVLFDQDNHDASDVTDLEAEAITLWNNRVVTENTTELKAMQRTINRLHREAEEMRQRYVDGLTRGS